MSPTRSNHLVLTLKQSKTNCLTVYPSLFVGTNNQSTYVIHSLNNWEYSRMKQSVSKWGWHTAVGTRLSPHSGLWLMTSLSVNYYIHISQLSYFILIINSMLSRLNYWHPRQSSNQTNKLRNVFKTFLLTDNEEDLKSLKCKNKGDTNIDLNYSLFCIRSFGSFGSCKNSTIYCKVRELCSLGLRLRALGQRFFHYYYRHLETELQTVTRLNHLPAVCWVIISSSTVKSMFSE